MSEKDDAGSSSAELTTTTAAAANWSSSLFLIDCLHPSVFNAGNPAASADVQRCFRIILKLLSNHLQDLDAPAYASFSAVSSTWQGGVLPCVYVLRLVAWMTCAPNSEGSRYIFCSGAAEDVTHTMEDRLHELRCVMMAWNTSLAALNTGAGLVPLKRQRVLCGNTPVDTAPAGDKGERLASARATLVALYTHADSRASSLQDKRSCMYTRALQLQLLCMASRLVEGAAKIEPQLLHSSSSSSLSWWWSRASAELQACYAHLTDDDSLHWLVRHTPLCALSQECEHATVVAAAGAQQSPLQCPSPSFSSSVSTAAALADRFRRQARAEQHQRYLDTTGAAYRRLSHEERHRGESVVLDIAGLLEQIALITETQGMVRVDRQEARRLLDDFRMDGDLAKLYALQERYTTELEEAKTRYGKPLVFGREE
jgi:hypothetical protein